MFMMSHLMPPNFFFFLVAPHDVWDPSSPTDQGSNLHPLHWKHGVLSTGLPGKCKAQKFK